MNDDAANTIANLIAQMSEDGQAVALQFLEDMERYEQHRMEDGNMPHDVGEYCECPDCTGEEQ